MTYLTSWFQKRRHDASIFLFFIYLFFNSFAYHSSSCSSLQYKKSKRRQRRRPSAEARHDLGRFKSLINTQPDNSCGLTVNQVWPTELQLRLMPQFKIIPVIMSFSSVIGLYTPGAVRSTDWVELFSLAVKIWRRKNSIYFLMKKNHNSWTMAFVARQPWASFSIHILSSKTFSQSNNSFKSLQKKSTAFNSQQHIKCVELSLLHLRFFPHCNKRGSWKKVPNIRHCW